MATFTYTSKDNLYVSDLATDSSTADVYGLHSAVKNVSVGIVGFDHGWANDVDLLLVAPDRQHNLVVMSDTGGSHGYGGFNFTFSDTGLTQMGDPITSGAVYKPTDNGLVETAANWGLNIPIINHPPGSTFASSFAGIEGNGDWSLFMRDDAPGQFGGISQWKLTVTTDDNFAALVGTSGDDIIRVIGSGYSASGTFEINERGPVAFDAVFDFSEEGGAGNDLIITGGGVDRIYGGTGRDSVFGGDGHDYLFVGAGDDVAGEIYDGGSLDDWLIHESYETLDLRDDTLNSVEILDLKAGGKMLVTAAQMGGVAHVLGGLDLTHPDVFAVTMGASTYLDLGSVGFDAFNHAGDHAIVKGDASDEFIIGSKVNDVIKAGGGDDFIVTNLGIDAVDGGKGRDTVSYLTRTVAVQVTLDGSHKVNVKVDGLVEDSIRNVENVRGGSGNDILKGDKLANVLEGSDGADKLKGLGGNDKLEGGLGLDKTFGGAGKDQFVFATALDVADHIKDFSHADDTIVLDNAIFAAFAKLGGIKSKAFHANATGHDAHTAKQKLIYDKADHSLWYDADGNGAGAAIEIAVFDNKVKNIDFHDFLIV